MKKQIMIISSCIILALLLVVPSFAIARYDAYPFWSDGTITINPSAGNSSVSLTKTKGTNLFDSIPEDIKSPFYNAGYYSNQSCIASGQFSFTSTGDNTIGSLAIEFARPVTIPNGEYLEFYVYTERLLVQNVTQDKLWNYGLVAPYTTGMVTGTYCTALPIASSGRWTRLRVTTTANQSNDGQFSQIRLIYYMNTGTHNSGDLVDFDVIIKVSSVVIGKDSDIGYNPDVNPEDDAFREEVNNQLGGVNEKLENQNNALESIKDQMSAIESELSRDDTFDDVTAWPDADIENVIPESDALIEYEYIMQNAYQVLEDANLTGAQTWWQDVFTKVLTIPLAGMMALISSSLLIIRALLGR